MEKIIILGAGLAGMAAAEQLIEQGKKNHAKFDITILEQNKEVGGLASSFLMNGKYIPKYYHHVFRHDKTTQKYLKKFNLLDKVAWKKIKMGICHKNKIYNFTDPVSLLKFDYLSLYGRLRYGLFGFYVFFMMNPNKISDNMNAKAWLDKYAGREVTDKIFYHLYARNKFNIPLERISARQFAFRLKAREAMGRFGYPVTGLQSFIDAFERYLKKNKVNIIKNSKINKINVKSKKVIVKNKEMDYDYLISTIPLPVFIRLSSGLPERFVQKVSKISYCPCVCVAFGTDRFLTNHYWINLINETTHTLFQHSNLFDGYGRSNKINWILRYGGSEADLDLSDSEIRKQYLQILKKLFPKVNIIWTRVFKEKYAEPVYDKDYSSNMPSIKAGISGLYFAGTGVSYPKIRNMNSSLETGIEAAEEILKDVRKL
jgi:protoporphyrinogen oxidase